MKKFILMPCLLVVAAAAIAQKAATLPFVLKGSIDEINEPAHAILQYFNGEKRVSDTVQLLHGNFKVKGAISKPVKGVLTLLKSSDNPRMMISMGYDGSISGRDGMVIYLDKGKLLVKGKTLSTAKVRGSAAHKDYRILQNELKPLHERLNAINKEMSVLSPDKRKGEAQDRLMNQVRETFKEMQPVEEAFIRSHLHSYVSWNLVADKSIIDDPEGQKALFDSFGEKFRNSEEGQKLLGRIQAAFRTAIGQPAPQFTQDNTDGRPLSLASLKGKYVLIDFWASWCGPCRAENPHVVKAYNKFKGKNFEILAVSLDNKKEPWLKAITDDGLPWLHVSDLKGWKNEVAALYNVQAVPQNWLIDPNGVIIAKNMRGEELEKTLREKLK